MMYVRFCCGMGRTGLAIRRGGLGWFPLVFVVLFMVIFVFLFFSSLFECQPCKVFCFDKEGKRLFFYSARFMCTSLLNSKERKKILIK